MFSMPEFEAFACAFQAEDGIRDSSVTGVQTCALSIQAEDGIRDSSVTGVQTCALPILEVGGAPHIGCEIFECTGTMAEDLGLPIAETHTDSKVRGALREEDRKSVV